MSPVTFGAEIPKIHVFLETKFNSSQSTGYFAGNKCFSSDRRFMIKKDTITGIHIIGFPIINAYPIGIQLGTGIGRTGIKRSFFRLGSFLNFTKQFRSRGLIKFCFFFQPEDTNCFEQAKGAKGIRIGCVFRSLK